MDLSNSKTRVMVLVAGSVIVLGARALGALGDAGQEVNWPPELREPLPSELPRCRLTGGSALTHARELERLAEASWERTPYAAEEAPRAVLRVAEAEHCYGAAFDREGRQRTARKREEYAAELSRRWSRTRLLFEMARRADRLDELRRHIATLLALSGETGTSAVAYRQWLLQVDRDASAQLVEREQSKED